MSPGLPPRARPFGATEGEPGPDQSRSGERSAAFRELIADGQPIGLETDQLGVRFGEGEELVETVIATPREADCAARAAEG